MGKELFANLIQRKSNRNRNPYIQVNCSAIPKELIESEFFGHRKGSFTGASGDKDGLFQAADSGFSAIETAYGVGYRWSGA